MVVMETGVITWLGVIRGLRNRRNPGAEQRRSSGRQAAAHCHQRLGGRRRGDMTTRITSLCITLVLAATAASADPLAGKWVLNVGRSHYGGGAELRREETLTCHADREIVKCTIESVRIDGRKLVGTFSAAYSLRGRWRCGMSREGSHPSKRCPKDLL
jgi:hypothetical protein